MLLTPIFLLTFNYTVVHCNGSFNELANEFMILGPLNLITKVWPSPFYSKSWLMILPYMVFELILMKLVPGKLFKSTATPSGHVPVYIANGFQCYVISIISILALAYYKIFNPSEVCVNQISSIFFHLLPTLNYLGLR
jgi:7-dehydrocholesterol reductase